jgi:hypothetical protein
VNPSGTLVLFYSSKGQATIPLPPSNSSGISTAMLSNISTHNVLMSSLSGFGTGNVVDTVKSYGIVADGQTDNAEALLKMRSDLAGSDAHYNILLPHGTILSSNNTWLAGIKSKTVIGNNTVLRTIYDGVDEVQARAILDTDPFFSNLLSYTGTKIDNYTYSFLGAKSGEKTITLKTFSDASTLQVGERILLYNYDQTGTNYPPGARIYEWHVIESINGTEIALEMPLAYDYEDRMWPLSFGNSGSMKETPAFVSLDQGETPYSNYSEYSNITFGDSIRTDKSPGIPGNVQFTGMKVLVENCQGETGYWWPSMAKLSVYNNYRTKGSIEVDQVLGQIVTKNSEFGKAMLGPTGTESMEFYNCKIHGSLQCNPAHLSIKNVHLRGDDQPDEFTPTISCSPAACPVERMELENITFTSSLSNKSDYHISNGILLDYVVTHTDGDTVVIPFVSRLDNNTTKLPYKSKPRVTRICKEDGSAGGVIKNIYFDKDYNSGQGAYRIDLPFTPQVNETLLWSPITEIIDRGGHKVMDNKYLFGPDSMRWSGNLTPSGSVHTTTIDGRSIRRESGELRCVWLGVILSIEAIVTTPTPTTSKFGMAADDYTHILEINLEHTGRRYIDFNGAVNLQPGDQADVSYIGTFQKNLRMLNSNLPDLNQELGIIYKIKWKEL